MRWLDGITNSMAMSLGKLRRQWKTGKPGVLQSTGSQRVGHDLVMDQQQTLITSLVVPSPNTATLEVMAPTHEFEIEKRSVHNNEINTIILILQRKKL